MRKKNHKLLSSGSYQIDAKLFFEEIYNNIYENGNENVKIARQDVRIKLLKNVEMSNIARSKRERGNVKINSAPLELTLSTEKFWHRRAGTSNTVGTTLKLSRGNLYYDREPRKCARRTFELKSSPR